MLSIFSNYANLICSVLSNITQAKSRKIWGVCEFKKTATKLFINLFVCKSVTRETRADRFHDSTRRQISKSILHMY